MPESPEKQQITIFVNNKPLTTAPRELVGAEIKRLAAIPADYALYEVRGNQSSKVPDDKIVPLVQDLQFRAIPPGTFGVHAIPS
jgi:hypothetical protein